MSEQEISIENYKTFSDYKLLTWLDTKNVSTPSILTRVKLENLVYNTLSSSNFEKSKIITKRRKLNDSSSKIMPKIDPNQLHTLKISELQNILKTNNIPFQSKERKITYINLIKQHLYQKKRKGEETPISIRKKKIKTNKYRSEKNNATINSIRLKKLPNLVKISKDKEDILNIIRDKNSLNKRSTTNIEDKNYLTHLHHLSNDKRSIIKDKKIYTNLSIYKDSSIFDSNLCTLEMLPTKNIKNTHANNNSQLINQLHKYSGINDNLSLNNKKLLQRINSEKLSSRMNENKLHNNLKGTGLITNLNYCNWIENFYSFIINIIKILFTILFLILVFYSLYYIKLPTYNFCDTESQYKSKVNCIKCPKNGYCVNGKLKCDSLYEISTTRLSCIPNKSLRNNIKLYTKLGQMYLGKLLGKKECPIQYKDIDIEIQYLKIKSIIERSNIEENTKLIREKTWEVIYRNAINEDGPLRVKNGRFYSVKPIFELKCILYILLVDQYDAIFFAGIIITLLIIIISKIQYYRMRRRVIKNLISSIYNEFENIGKDKEINVNDMKSAFYLNGDSDIWEFVKNEVRKDSRVICRAKKGELLWVWKGKYV